VDIRLGDNYHYMPAPFVIGIFEFTMMRMDSSNPDIGKISRLFVDYLESGNSTRPISRTGSKCPWRGRCRTSSISAITWRSSTTKRSSGSSRKQGLFAVQLLVPAQEAPRRRPGLQGSARDLHLLRQRGGLPRASRHGARDLKVRDERRGAAVKGTEAGVLRRQRADQPAFLFTAAGAVAESSRASTSTGTRMRSSPRHSCAREHG